MNILIGTDIIENSRIERAINRTESFLNKVFTEQEIAYCNSRKAFRIHSFAARFAAKEAVAKALGTGFTQGVSPLQIEIIKEGGSCPIVRLSSQLQQKFPDIEYINVSMSHCKEYSTAYALIVLKKD